MILFQAIMFTSMSSSTEIDKKNHTLTCGFFLRKILFKIFRILLHLLGLKFRQG